MPFETKVLLNYCLEELIEMVHGMYIKYFYHKLLRTAYESKL